MTRTLKALTGLGLLAALAACVDVPDLGPTAPRGLDARPYPALIPLEGIAASAPTEQDAAQIEASLTWRAQRLQARAAALRAPVLDGASAARLSDEVGN